MVDVRYEREFARPVYLRGCDSTPPQVERWNTRRSSAETASPSILTRWQSSISKAAWRSRPCLRPSSSSRRRRTKRLRRTRVATATAGPEPGPGRRRRPSARRTRQRQRRPMTRNRRLWLRSSVDAPSVISCRRPDSQTSQIELWQRGMTTAMHFPRLVALGAWHSAQCAIELLALRVDPMGTNEDRSCRCGRLLVGRGNSKRNHPCAIPVAD